MPTLQGILRDGTSLVRRVRSRPPAERIADGIHRFPLEILSIDPSAEQPLHSLVVLAGDEMFHLDVAGRYNSVPVILGVTSAAAARGDRVVTGSTDRLELHLLDGRGDTLAVPSDSARGRAVEQEEVDSVRAEALEAMDAPGYRNLPRAVIEGFVEPQRERIRQTCKKHDAGVRRSRIDSEERTWVRLVGERGATVLQWLVYDRGGSPLGRVEVPSDLQFLDVRSRHLLAAGLDELDVPSVLVYEVLWPRRMIEAFGAARTGRPAPPRWVRPPAAERRPSTEPALSRKPSAGHSSLREETPRRFSGRGAVCFKPTTSPQNLD